MTWISDISPSRSYRSHRSYICRYVTLCAAYVQYRSNLGKRVKHVLDRFSSSRSPPGNIMYIGPCRSHRRGIYCVGPERLIMNGNLSCQTWAKVTGRPNEQQRITTALLHGYPLRTTRTIKPPWSKFQAHFLNNAETRETNTVACAAGVLTVNACRDSSHCRCYGNERILWLTLGCEYNRVKNLTHDTYENTYQVQVWWD